MSVGKLLSSQSNDSFIVPMAGKMFKSNIDSDDKALAFVLNKGYLQISDLSKLLDIIDMMSKESEIILVGGIEKVRLKRTYNIVYRQRVFFKDISLLLDMLSGFGVSFRLDNRFHIHINNILNCKDELVYLERYAKRFNQPIDVYLTNCCIIWVHFVLLSQKLSSPYKERVEVILRKKQGYFDRAPFIVGSYSIDTKTSSLLLCQPENVLSDTRYYSSPVTERTDMSYGYLDSVVSSDVKEGKL